jgi:lipopolysaccharide transport system permease protein
MLAEVRATFGTIAKHWRLMLELAKRDIYDRYSGQIFGSAWALIHPVFMISVFLFMFGVVFAPEIDIDASVPVDRAVYMVSGLLAWLVASDVLARSPSIVTGQADLVKQVIFPVEVLPIKTVLSTLPMLIVGFVLLVLYAAIRFDRVSVGYLLLPVSAVLLYAYLFGMALLLSAIGVFFRDLKDIVQLVILVGMYLAPIFYPLKLVPAGVRPLLYLNPMTIFVECFHDAAYFGSIQKLWVWLLACCLSVGMLLLGSFTFKRLKPQFGTFL